MEIREIPLTAIRLDARNPRTDGDQEIEELSASLAGTGLVQPPILLPEGDTYRVLVGERRVRAARQAGLEAIVCLVSEPLDPVAAHRARVVENLHRRNLNPIDHALSLRIAWLLANAEGLGLGEEARRLMQAERPLSAILPELEKLLDEHGFHPTAPAVTWERVLDELGVAMSAERRKKLLRVLSMPGDVQEKLRQLPVTEAAARALGTLDEDAQRQVLAAMEENPALVRRARRIAHAIRGHGYRVEEALAEASGQLPPEMVEAKEEATATVAYADDQAVVDAVMQFLDAANTFQSALQRLRSLVSQTLDIPDPWRNFYLNALSMLREEVETS